MTKILESQLKYKTTNEYSYNSIPIYAEEWVHEWVYSEFINLKVSKESKILILWCWAGSFDQRLIDAWFTDITSVDIEPCFYRATNINILWRDLNKDFEDIWRFDIIFAIEIIEHIENQFHFLRNITTCLNSGWYLLLTTPNVNPLFSRIKFLFTWIFNSFSPNSLRHLWHINPILDHIFLFNIGLNNLELIKKIWLWELKIKRKNIKNSIWNTIYLIIWGIFWISNFIISFYIIRK